MFVWTKSRWEDGENKKRWNKVRRWRRKKDEDVDDEKGGDE